MAFSNRYILVTGVVTGPDHLLDGPCDGLRLQHRGGSAPLPSVRKRQEAHSYVGY
jgi:hypothetical protein